MTGRSQGVPTATDMSPAAKRAVATSGSSSRPGLQKPQPGGAGWPKFGTRDEAAQTRHPSLGCLHRSGRTAPHHMLLPRRRACIRDHSLPANLPACDARACWILPPEVDVLSPATAAMTGSSAVRGFPAREGPSGRQPQGKPPGRDDAPLLLFDPQPAIWAFRTTSLLLLRGGRSDLCEGVPSAAG